MLITCYWIKQTFPCYQKYDSRYFMINIWVQILLIHNAFLIKLTLVKKKNFSSKISLSYCFNAWHYLGSNVSSIWSLSFLICLEVIILLKRSIITMKQIGNKKLLTWTKVKKFQSQKACFVIHKHEITPGTNIYLWFLQYGIFIFFSRWTTLLIKIEEHQAWSNGVSFI